MKKIIAFFFIVLTAKESISSDTNTSSFLTTCNTGDDKTGVDAYLGYGCNPYLYRKNNDQGGSESFLPFLEECCPSYSGPVRFDTRATENDEKLKS
jgi:hypothetical protein